MSDLSTPAFSATDLDKIIHALLLWVPQNAASYAAKVAEWSSLPIEERSFNMLMSNIGVIAAVRLSIAAQHVVGSATADGLTILGEGVQEGTQQILGELRRLVAERVLSASPRTSTDAKRDRASGGARADRASGGARAGGARADRASGGAQADASPAAQAAAKSEAT